MTEHPVGVRSPLPSAAPTLDERWAESRGPLVERLRDRILADGPITFAAFMSAALYDPADGYYMTRSDRTTRAGDFLTAPEMDPLFGAALATHLEAGWERLGRPDPFALHEFGAGSGALASGLLHELRARRSPLLDAIRYRPVEADPAHEAAVLQRLEAEGFGPERVQHDPDALVTGVVVANELLDALPVHRVTVADGEVRELYTTWRDGWFADEPGPRSDPALEATLAASGIRLRDGDRAEVSLAAQTWVKEAVAPLARGWLLLIDYGGPGATLWGAPHPDGLLRTYRAHHAGADPYRAVGLQDLTAHVDTTAISAAAEAAGLTPIGETSLAEFLAGLETGELLVRLGSDPATTAERYRTARGALLRLLDPGAMGRFAVLGFGRGMTAQPPLRGFDFRLARG
ncbi:MAG TPA: SAM-dependent methyltransferase [Candidatus Limnocylindrales bacterium]